MKQRNNLVGEFTHSVGATIEFKSSSETFDQADLPTALLYLWKAAPLTTLHQRMLYLWKRKRFMEYKHRLLPSYSCLGLFCGFPLVLSPQTCDPLTKVTKGWGALLLASLLFVWPTPQAFRIALCTLSILYLKVRQELWNRREKLVREEQYRQTLLVITFVVLCSRTLCFNKMCYQIAF